MVYILSTADNILKEIIISDQVLCSLLNFTSYDSENGNKMKALIGLHRFMC